jgi:glycosyltransferase involved in cell wall biosynthesis
VAQKKIVQCITSLAFGGAERLVVDLSNYLINNPNFEIHVLTFSEIEHSFKIELEPRIRYKCIKKKSKFDILFQVRLFYFLLRQKPEVVHTHLSGTVLYLYFPSFFIRNTKYFHTIHNIADEEIPSVFFQRIRKIAYKICKINPVSISEATRISHLKLYNLDTAVVYNGISEKKPSPLFSEVKREMTSIKKNGETKIFLSIGRINSPRDQKNYKLLTQVFNKLGQGNMNVSLVVIGEDTSEKKEVLKHLQSISSSFIHFVGRKKNTVDYLLNSDFFCLSSKFEGVPITIIEAMSHGIPIVSTNVGGVKEMITDNENGLLVTESNVDTYYHAIKEILSWDSDKLNAIRSANLLKYRSVFSIKTTAESYMKLYQL